VTSICGEFLIRSKTFVKTERKGCKDKSVADESRTVQRKTGHRNAIITFSLHCWLLDSLIHVQHRI